MASAASAASARVGIIEIEPDYTLPVALLCISVPFFIFGVWGMLKGDPSETEAGDLSESGESGEVSEKFGSQIEQI